MIEDGYSICFNRWVLDTRIKNELPILLIISSLTAKTGECFASNQYFAMVFNCTEVSISQKINKLIKLGYISAEYEKRGAEVKKRVLRLKNFLTVDLNNFYPSIKNIFKDNNISINNTSINKENILKEKNEKILESFELFWKEYPKQRAGNKQKSFKAYCRVIKEKRSDENKLLEAVKNYAKSEEVSRGFAKGCEAWLNDDRFNCEYKQKTNWEFF